MIRLGLVGSNFGCRVLLPAFRADVRCEITGLAASDSGKTSALAAKAGIPRAFATWSDLVDDPSIDAIAIAVPPAIQPQIALRALENGKAVFLEKPIACSMKDADALLHAAQLAKKPVAVDFEFPELPIWQRTKALLDDGAVGAVRHVIVTWNVEHSATQARLKNWKTDGEAGGGALGHFVSHCFYYLEDFCGPIANLYTQISGLPGEDSPAECTVILAGSFASGAALSLTVSTASYLGSGHRIEIYGEDGALFLTNTTDDYMRGFELFHARRPSTLLKKIVVEDPQQAQYEDGRIAPISRLASRFLDAIETGAPMRPGIHEGHRVQFLIEKARESQDLSQSVLAFE